MELKCEDGETMEEAGRSEGEGGREKEENL